MKTFICFALFVAAVSASGLIDPIAAPIAPLGLAASPLLADAGLGLGGLGWGSARLAGAGWAAGLPLGAGAEWAAGVPLNAGLGWGAGLGGWNNDLLLKK